MWLEALIVLCVLCSAAGRLTLSKRVYKDVVTTQGTVRGYMVHDPLHFEYFGIPYARAPMNRDRFKAPKPPPEWDGVFEATHKVKCPQLTADGEENCLVLNIFTPEDADGMPVIVFVHGGHFQNGYKREKENFNKQKPSGQLDYEKVLKKEMSVYETEGVRGEHLSMVYEYLMTLKPTSVEAERAFSAAGYILCSAVRSRLRDKTT